VKLEKLHNEKLRA